MRKAVFLFAAVVSVAAALTCPAAAQDKAAEVLRKMRETIGGGKLDSLATFRLEARSARNVGERQITSDLELYLGLPDRYLRVDNVTAPIARTLTTGFNGDKPIRPAGSPGGSGEVISFGSGAVGAGGGGAIIMTRPGAAGGGMRGGGSGGGTVPTPEQQAMMDAGTIRGQRVELSRLLLGWFGAAHPALQATYSYGGEAESPDGKAHIINVRADGGFDVKLFIDQATNLPLMVSYEAPEPVRMPPAAAGDTPQTAEDRQRQMQEAMKNRRMIEHRIYFADWQETGWLRFPHLLQRATVGATTEEWTITKVELNPNIDGKFR